MSLINHYLFHLVEVHPQCCNIGGFVIMDFNISQLFWHLTDQTNFWFFFSNSFIFYKTSILITKSYKSFCIVCILWNWINFKCFDFIWISIIPLSVIRCPNYPSAEQIWLCIRLNNAGKWAWDRLTEDADFSKKKSSFQMKLIFEKLTHPKRVTVWCGVWSRGIIGPLFFGNEPGGDVTVNGDRYRAMLNEFLFTKIEEEDIGNIWLQQDGATCTQPKLHWMICTLFLKIALSATELMSFGHLGAAIWHLWTIIFGVLSKISITPTSQRQLAL